MDIPKYKTWQEQVKHAITTIEELSKYLPLSDKEKEELLKVTKKFPLRVTPYYLSLINPKDKKDRNCSLSLTVKWLSRRIYAPIASHKKGI